VRKCVRARASVCTKDGGAGGKRVGDSVCEKKKTQSLWS
jgi:hypothetical protein